jgi:ornithine carbamoyltransferase
MPRPKTTNPLVETAMGRRSMNGHGRSSAKKTRSSAKAKPAVRHVRSMFDLSADETNALIDLALKLKEERDSGTSPQPLPGKVLGLVFEKPSTRTRVSFECAMAHLGGNCVFLTGSETGVGERESEHDFAKVMSGYVDVLAVRTFGQQRVDELAKHATVPVINALSDTEHPCQALGDFAAMKRHASRLKGLKLAFVGDANNVARSLASTAAMTGVQFTLACPDQYKFPKEFLARLSLLGGGVHHQVDPAVAVADADFVYTDVWTSMGQEKETTMRNADFAGYQVDAALMAKAKPTAKFLHCLPAKRGAEVSAEVIDGPASMVFEQAEFRLHAEKALLLFLLSGPDVLGSGRAVRR